MRQYFIRWSAFFAAWAVVLLIFTPALLTYAQGNGAGSGGPGGGTVLDDDLGDNDPLPPTDGSGGGDDIPPVDGSGGGSGSDNRPVIENPLGDTDTIQKFLDKILSIVIDIGIPIIVLLIIYTGFLFVQAQGNANKLEEARSALLNVLIGTTIVLGAYAISAIIQNTVDTLK